MDSVKSLINSKRKMDPAVKECLFAILDLIAREPIVPEVIIQPVIIHKEELVPLVIPPETPDPISVVVQEEPVPEVIEVPIVPEVIQPVTVVIPQEPIVPDSIPVVIQEEPIPVVVQEVVKKAVSRFGKKS